MDVREQEDQTVSPEIVALTESVGALAGALEHLNAVILVLLYNQKQGGLSFPNWKDKAGVERSVGEELAKCIELISNLKEEDGPSTTSLSS